MNRDELVKEISRIEQAFAEPFDFDKLIEDGVLTRKGRSYCVKDIAALPDNVRRRIRTLSASDDCARVTFCKDSKSIKKLAERYKRILCQ